MPAVGIAPVADVVKRMRCNFCKDDSHETKDCMVDRYCYICDNIAHPTMRCPILRLPKPYAGMAGIGSDETMFNTLPGGVFKPQLAPSVSPIAIVTVTGEPVAADVI